MKLPRDISGSELVQRLKKYDYSIQRQVGSHIRIYTPLNGGHKITIPNHDPIRIGTFSNILLEIASHLEKDKQEVVRELFAK